MEIRFAGRSTRKHRVGRARALHAMNNITTIRPGSPAANGKVVYLGVGFDDRGVELELGFVIDDDVVTVIHVMPAHYRKKK